jgi:hypothetical protein
MAITRSREAFNALRFLFLLEIDFQRRARSASVGPMESAELHASFAIQHGYERRLAQARGATATDFDRLFEELTPTADPEDVLRAAGLLRSILNL